MKKNSYNVKNNFRNVEKPLIEKIIFQLYQPCLTTIMDAATLTGLAAGIGWIGKKVVKENLTSDPSSSGMNYAKFVAVILKK